MNSHQADAPKGDILIVDDTPNNLRLLEAALTEQGYEVRCVTNGSIQRKAFRSHRRLLRWQDPQRFL